jgi:putative SOS response-associated peptidase YedK
MCGRYALFGPRSRLREQFGAELPEDWLDRYNIAPSQLAPVLRVGPDGRREAVLAQWGLLPHWAQDPAALTRPINAKLETAATRPMFRHAMRKARVLVPASGFYEWQPTPQGKQPFFIRPAGGEAGFGLGGLLEHWDGPQGPVLSFAILTTAANAALAPIHERMPVIIRAQDYARWLDPALTDAEGAHALAAAYPAEAMRLDPVGRAVGNPRAEGAELIRPLPGAAED